jgi:RHS repeat-associated protein
MADQSGTAEQLISLPKGGGALRGIGESFSADLHTGTGNFSVPVATPPGRHRFGPNLSLAYSTGAGNGPFGLGWALSLPAVTRRTSRGLPTYDDDADTFVLSGTEDLVAVEQSAGITRYRPRTEGLFARIEHHRGTVGDFWQVWGQDGLVSRFGSARPADAGPDWRDPAALSDPAEPGRVFAWQLSSTVDPFGNRIEYEYWTDLGESFVQTYPRRVRYVDHGDPARFLVSVGFEYEDRPDVVSDRRARFDVRTRWRCREIGVNVEGVANGPVRVQRFSYDTSAHNGLSLLAGVVVEGRDGDRTEALPPLRFGYTPFEPAGRRFTALRGGPLADLADPGIELVDLNGNGLPDLLETGGGMRYWRNLGDGRFDRPRMMRNAPTGVELGEPGVRLLDADGDGRADLLVNDGALAGYFTLAGGEWDAGSFHRYQTAPSFGLDDPELRLVDLDGDGVTDALRTGTRFECFFNDRQLGWHATRVIERGRYPRFPDVSFADPRVHLADMTGDGLPDIVVVHDGRLEYWPSLGHGDFAPLVTMRDSPRFGEGFDPRRVYLGDVDGDGAADVVYVDDDSVTLWVNRSGQGFSPPVRIKGTPSATDLSAVRLVDLLGTGVAGVLFGTHTTSSSGVGYYFLDFTGGLKPALLDSMDNNTGALTRVSYAPSTRFYLDDEPDPATRWTTTLPFPVQVVASVEVTDHFSGGTLTSTYRYHHGYWDGAEREFRGFGRVDHLDTEAFTGDTDRYSPPVQTRTWFHLGPVGPEFGSWSEFDPRSEFWPGDPPLLTRPAPVAELLASLPRRAGRDAVRALRGQVLRTELYELDGSERASRPVVVTESLPGVREENPPRATDGERRRVFFPHQLAARTTQWERGTDPMTTLNFNDDFDSYGHARTQTSIAVPRSRDPRAAAPGEPCLATQIVRTLAGRDDDRRYLAGVVAVVTTYELRDERVHSVLGLHEAAVRGEVPRRIVGHTVNRYDGPAFEGLPAGELGEHGLLSRSDSLVLTEEILAGAYGRLPGYLADPATWPEEYPQEFRDRTAPRAGYTFQPGGDGSPYPRGYYVATRRNRYDVHDGAGRGLLLASRDQVGAESTVDYDGFGLLPVRTVDPAGLVTVAEYDYRTFQPRGLTDPNGNRTVATFTPLGLLDRTAVMGKPDEPVGDTLDAPTVRLVHDLTAFVARGEPVSVRTIRRVHHVHDTDVPADERDETIECVEFTDGFGRLLQTRTQAEDVVFGDLDELSADAVGTAQPERVVVSGWQTYDNKGRVVEKYEPFYATGFTYAAPGEAELGRKAVIRYDPRGRMTRTTNPDGSQLRVVHGVPTDLTDPDVFAPSAWEVYSYDANDNAGRTHPEAATGYREHWDTPSSVVVDALGRTVESVARNGHSDTDRHTVRSSYDIQGNRLALVDELGRVAFRHTYDLAGHALRTDGLDAGVARVVLDAAGRRIEHSDAKGALVLHGFDPAGRAVRVWARDRAGHPVTLRQILVYGDAEDSGLTRPVAAAANLLGALVRHYDEAGLAVVERRDVAGNVVESGRQVVDDDELLTVYQDAAANDWQIAPWRIDWQPPPGTTLAAHAAKLLDPETYRTSSTFDALGRVRTIQYPSDVDGHRAQLRARYNRAGELESAALDGTPFVERIAYDARGRRTLVAYGNGVLTRYGYQRSTPRLSRLVTQRATLPAPLTYRPGVTMQDFAYSYDLNGNLLTVLDRTPGSGVPGNPDAAQLADQALARLVVDGDALLRRFDYDPCDRLVAATGREHDLPAALPPWLDVPGARDVTGTRTYRQQYSYDAAGNLLRLAHASAGGSAVRDFALATGNRLASLTTGQAVFRYGYDATGNLTSEGDSRFLEWNHTNQPVAFRVQAGSSEPSTHAQYLYDASGQRVKKLVRAQGGGHVSTTYVGSLFEHRRHVAGTTNRESSTLHVMDGATRVAVRRIGPSDPDDRTPSVQYHFGDHLGSSHLVLDVTAAEVSREEYAPYGETTFGSVAHKRYRFTGKERDEESSLYYHAARYYAPWLARWTACDPAGTVDGTNLYAYVRGNPMLFVDPHGRQSQPGTRKGNPNLAPDVTRTTTLDAGHSDGSYDTVDTSVHGATLPGLPVGGSSPRLDTEVHASSNAALGTLVWGQASAKRSSGGGVRVTASGTFFAPTVEPMPRSVADADRWIAETISRSLGTVRFDVSAAGGLAKVSGRAAMEQGNATGTLTGKVVGIPVAGLNVTARVASDLSVRGSFNGHLGAAYSFGRFAFDPHGGVSVSAFTIGNTFAIPMKGAPQPPDRVPDPMPDPKRPPELAGPKQHPDGMQPKGPMFGASYSIYRDGGLAHIAAGLVQGNPVELPRPILGIRKVPIQAAVALTIRF